MYKFQFFIDTRIFKDYLMMTHLKTCKFINHSSIKAIARMSMNLSSNANN